MSNIAKGIIAGLIFGIISIIPRIFMEFESKPRAMTASFISRFAIGFIIFNMELPKSGWLKGGLIGIVLSLPDAIVTKQYAPILGTKDNELIAVYYNKLFTHAALIQTFIGTLTWSRKIATRLINFIETENKLD